MFSPENEAIFFPMERRKSMVVHAKSHAKLIVFIKPFDEEVFRSLYVFIKFI